MTQLKLKLSQTGRRASVNKLFHRFLIKFRLQTLLQIQSFALPLLAQSRFEIHTIVAYKNILKCDSGEEQNPCEVYVT